MIEKARPPAWEPQGTPGQRGIRRRRRHRGSPNPGLQGSNVDCSGRSGKTIKGENKAGEYLAYPRVLRPLLSIYAFVSNGKGRLYIVDCKVEIQNKDKKLGLSKTSIFRQVLQHEVRISQQFNITVMKVTMQQKLL